MFRGSSSSEKTLTYGLAVQDCPELTEDCFDPYHLFPSNTVLRLNKVVEQYALTGSTGM